jgi:hypothetical protein
MFPHLFRKCSFIKQQSGTHRRSQVHLLHVLALGSRGFRFDDRFNQGAGILDNLNLVERDLADPRVNDSGFIDTILDLARLGFLDGSLSHRITVPVFGFGNPDREGPERLLTESAPPNASCPGWLSPRQSRSQPPLIFATMSSPPTKSSSAASSASRSLSPGDHSQN